MNDHEQEQLKDVVKELGIRARSVPGRIITPEGFGSKATHWTVSLSIPASKWRAGQHKRYMVQGYSMGSAHKGKPRAVDVLSCLACDAQGAEQSFEDWCSDLGYDTDSRKAFDIYTVCGRIGVKLLEWCGSKAVYDRILAAEH